MRRYSWLALALIASLLAACGGDDEPTADEVKKPELTVPQDDTSGESTDETTDTDTDSTEGDVGEPDAPPTSRARTTAASPRPTTTSRPPPDSPTNDTPPEPGSPAERFEQFCAQNPGAC